ncbi:MAG: amidohydrolase family protein, partial [Pseudomonadales bacterium]
LKGIETHKAGRARDADVWPQVSCRPLAFSQTMVEPFTFNTNSVFAELMPKSLDERRAAYGDPAWRRRVRESWAVGDGLRPDWSDLSILDAPATPSAVGKRVLDLASEENLDPFDKLMQLTLAEPDLKLRVRTIVANGDQDGIAMLLNADHCTLGLSDTGAHVGQLCDAVLSSDLLGVWVREKRVLTLEQAVNKLTKVQADLYGFKDRGELRTGAYADVVVFDPATVAPGPVQRVRDFPANGERLNADQPTGIHAVFVNGVQIVQDGALLDSALDQRPGRLLAPG